MTRAGNPTLSVAAILAESAARFPKNVALLFDDVEINYEVLWRETREYAGALAARQIGYGDAVAVLIPNVPDFPRVYYAILALGAVVVPVHPLLKPSEIEHVLKDSEAKLLVFASDYRESATRAAATTQTPLFAVGRSENAPVDDIAPRRLESEAQTAQSIETYRSMSPLDPATILYTSGTTGKPKGAVLSHLSLVEQVHVALLDSFDVRTDDVLCGTLPLSHTFGQSNVMNTAFRRGASVLLFERFDATEVLRQMVSRRATIFAGVPTMFIGLLKAAHTMPQRPPLRYAISGGASLPLAIMEAFIDEYDAPIYEGYGLTETSPTATFNHMGREVRAGSIGTPIWGVDVRIADERVGSHVVFQPDGVRGEVVIRGHNLFLGYHNNIAASYEAIADGWFRTGDIGVRDCGGYITIVDRTKDMILRNGYNVYPREIEEVLARYPGVRSVAVFGVADDECGQEVVAAIVPSGTIAAEDMLEWARQRIAAHKCPQRIEIVEDLPLGPSGKVLKRVLAARFANR